MYKKMYCNGGIKPRTSKNDIIVRPDLSVTPAQAMRLAEKGIPVSTQTASSFSDGSLNPSWEVPLDRCRGIDPAVLWEKQQEIRTKIVSAHKRDVDKYGNEID